MTRAPGGTMQRAPIHLVSTAVLRQRRAELHRARLRLDEELERLTAALRARDPNTPPIRVAKHGTESGYVQHRKRWGTPPCTACKKAHSAAQAAYRARAKARAEAQTASPDPTTRRDDANA